MWKVRVKHVFDSFVRLGPAWLRLSWKYVMKVYDDKNEFNENIFCIEKTDYELDPDYGWGPCHEGARELAQLYDKSKI